MKKFTQSSFLAFALIIGSVSQNAQAMEVVAIVAAGSVSTVALSGTAAVLGGARFKTQAYHEAMDVVASGDVSMMTPTVKKIIADLKEGNPSVRQMDDLELLEAVLNSELISE